MLGGVYVIPIQVPFYLDAPGPGRGVYVTTEWKRSLELLRDSLEAVGLTGGRPLTVVAPYLPVSAGAAQVLERVGRDEGVRAVPVLDKRVRRREWLLTGRRVWRAAVRRQLAGATVVHAGLDDLHRPMAYLGFLEAVRAGVATVFVQDTDIALQRRELAASRGVGPAGLIGRVRDHRYAAGYERRCRAGVAVADLSLLKGERLMARYGAFARNPCSFQDTSYLAREVISESELERRLTRLTTGPGGIGTGVCGVGGGASPAGAGRLTDQGVGGDGGGLGGGGVRLVYAGRLIARKGLEVSLRVVGLARALGADVTLDVIGDGPELGGLMALRAALGLEGVVSFHGKVPYGSELLRRLGMFDGLLFTPTAEDTPRLIFDAYAAGLPVIATGIEYVLERARGEGATVVLPRGDVAAAARVLHGVATRDRGRLAELSRAARRAALEHAADTWYRRRAEWTLDAVRRRASERSATDTRVAMR